MSRSTDRAAVRPLPRGLRICATCGEARGTTPDGAVSACYCSELICNRCGDRRRRPVTDYYDRRDRVWAHVPYFALMAHACRVAPGRELGEKGFTDLGPDPNVAAYQAEVTRLTHAEVDGRRAERAERAGAEVDEPSGRDRLARESRRLKA